GLATQYYAISHPSLPNYLAMTAGSTFGITSDCTTCWVGATNLADQIEAGGRSWKAYLEGMPSACFVGDAYPYMQKHNPWIYYNDIRTNAARCSAHVVPFTQLGADLASGSVPSYVWITPNMCNDMHDCSIATGDSWLRSQVPAILNSAAYRNGGVLVITWDEGKSRLTIVPSFGERLLAAAIFLALEVPLAVIAYRVTRRLKPFLVPAGLLVAALVVPDPVWAALLLIAGLFTMFGQAIGARVRKTTEAERRQLAAHGPSPWLGQSRRSSLTLIGVGAVRVLVGIGGTPTGTVRI